MFTYLSFFGIVEAAVQVQCTDTMIKGGSVEERLYKKTSLYSKFEFCLSVTPCLPFKKNFSSHFFSNWKSALCSESLLQKPKQKPYSQF